MSSETDYNKTCSIAVGSAPLHLHEQKRKKRRGKKKKKEKH